MSSFSPQAGKEKILIVDDSEMNRMILGDILEDDFDIILAENGVVAVEILKKMYNEISLVMLDMVMPEMDGFGVLLVMNQFRWIDNIPVIMISVENSSENIEKAYDLGVAEYIKRPFDSVSVRRRVINTIKLYANQRKLVSLVADQIYEKEKNNSMMISILSHTVEFRNGESGMHVLNVRTITETLLTRLVAKHPEVNISRSDIAMIALTSALHDIGKIGIPDEILNKPGKFTPEEFAIMKNHSMLGAKILADLPFKNEPMVKTAYEICRWHHERYDGRGYPDGLVGDEIPMSAQVVSVADVYDALTSERVYKKAFTHEKAMEMILGGECGTFNPILMECLKESARQLREDLTSNSNASMSRQDVKELTETMLKNNEINFSDQMSSLMETEKIKYQFLSSVSREIQFDYIDEPSLLTLTEWSARRLGLPENTIDPKKDERVLEMLPLDNLNEMSSRMHSTTPEEPVVEYSCDMKIDGAVKPCKIICRSIWSTGKSTRYIGAVGKLIVSSDDAEAVDMKYITSRDPLTGLYNSLSARKLITDILLQNPHKQYVMTVISLARLSTGSGGKLNHLLHDAALKITAKRIAAAIGPEDVAARADENNFIVFIPCDGGCEENINKLLKAVTYSCGNFSISSNIGAASTENCERKYSCLYASAMMALKSIPEGSSDDSKYVVYH